MAQANDETQATTAGDSDEIIVEEAPTEESATATATLTDEKSESPLAGERVVYVEGPIHPKEYSNRVVGSLLALVGTVLFAIIYAAVGALIIATGWFQTFRQATFGTFIQDSAFWVPVLFFAIGFVLVVLLLNRAGWWLHVVGSLLVAIIVYFGSIGVLLLLTGIAGTPATFATLATQPFTVAAALVAREVSIWVGFLIAARGTKVKARNKAARDEFDTEQAERASGKKASDGAAPAQA
ncbi:MAG: hypothetical protein ABIR17_06070 [Pseudolysinimonas sp.]|uniref:hypothetical protein n=1 Tax=Pseudolysinimonas sp. TaxID=2680009 RepID=UPI003264E2BE